MNLQPITALSPLDGRYESKVSALREHFSEFGLIRNRIKVEIEWLKALAAAPELAEIAPFSAATVAELDAVIADFSVADGEAVKAIEATTNHDVKAMEYWLKKRLGHNAEVTRVTEFIHFGCTSEDINNVSHALMLRDGRDGVLLPAVDRIIDEAYAMERYIDAQAGGPGKGWFHVVQTPAEARTTIEAGKLAVDIQRFDLQALLVSLFCLVVLRAMGLLVDRPSIQAFLYGRQGVATHYFINNPKTFRGTGPAPEFSVEKARQVLDAAGCSVMPGLVDLAVRLGEWLHAGRTPALISPLLTPLHPQPNTTSEIEPARCSAHSWAQRRIRR